MNRDALIALLSRLIADGILTEGAALDLIAQFDVGTLREWDLPLSPTPYVHDHDREKAALALLLLLLGHDTVTKLPSQTARRFSDELQDDYQAAVIRRAQKFYAGNMNLKRWQRLMLDGIAVHVIAQTMLGSGAGSISPDQLDQLAETMNVQSAYLQRFADHIAYNAGIGTPYSEAQIAHRSIGYGGVGRAAFYEALVGSLADSGQSGGGWVLEYHAVDDKGTCGPCHDAQGFYLQDRPHPTPGSICLGGGYCRCTLMPVYRSDIFAELTGS